MLYAVIDTGANSVKLVLLEEKGGKFERVYHKLEITRLAEDLEKNGVFGAHAMQRTLDALKDFIRIAKEKGAAEIYLLGMAAFRNAKNSAEFIEQIRKETGIVLRVLTGEEEARYGTIGVASSLGIEDFIMLDIGGGSVEITAHHSEEEYLASIPAGVVTLCETFVKSDPPLPEEKTAMENFIREKFADAINDIVNRQITTLGSDPKVVIWLVIGVGGSITSIATMLMQMKEFDTPRVHLYKIEYEKLKDLNNKLWQMTLAQRKAIPGLHPLRADVIISGTLLTQIVMEMLNADTLTVSVANLVEGVLEELGVRSQHSTKL